MNRTTAYKVFIPNWRPATVNALLKAHWAARNKQKKSDMTMVWAYCRHIPKAETKRSVEVKIRLTGRQKACDPDNLWKSLLDALVKNGLLKNDTQEWVETLPPVFERGSVPGTEITLRDI